MATDDIQKRAEGQKALTVNHVSAREKGEKLSPCSNSTKIT